MVALCWWVVFFCLALTALPIISADFAEFIFCAMHELTSFAMHFYAVVQTSLHSSLSVARKHTNRLSQKRMERGDGEQGSEGELNWVDLGEGTDGGGGVVVLEVVAGSPSGGKHQAILLASHTWPCGS